MEKFVEIIQNVGFPIFVSLFLLFRIEPTMKRIGEVMAQIQQFMEDHQ